MARSGMSHLISKLRALTASGTADYSVSGTTFWTDDQLQSVLDQWRVDFKARELVVSQSVDNGVVHWYDYYLRDYQWVEGTASGTAAWLLTDAIGGTVAYSAYTLNMDALHLQFTSDTLGTVYYLSGRAYDMYQAAGDVWEQKAADVADRFDLKTDNHDMKRSQLYDHYMKMAKRYRAKGGVQTSTMTRPDAWIYADVDE